MASTSVVITKFREFTDVIMTLPVIYSACHTNPEVSFRLVTRTPLVSLFINPPSNLTVEGYDFPENPKFADVGALWRFLLDRGKASYYVLLDGGRFFKVMATMGRFKGLRVSMITPAPEQHKLIRKNNKIMLPLTTARSRYREAFYRIGIPIQEHFRGLYGPDGRGDASLFASVTPPPAKGERWIGIAPFAKHRGKAYPPELMEEVLSIIEKEVEGVKVILFGGGETERAILTDWSRRHTCAFTPATARLGLPAELSLLSYLDVMLTMDSANMHLASLVGVKVITVWGATHPYCGYKGWHQNESGTVSLPMPCRPCSLYGDKPCHRGDYHCLRGISPQLIIDKINEK